MTGATPNRYFVVLRLPLASPLDRQAARPGWCMMLRRVARLFDDSGGAWPPTVARR